MRIGRLVIFLSIGSVLFGLNGCSSGTKSDSADNPPQASPPVVVIVPKQNPDVELERQFAEIAKEARGKVGISARVLETGETASLNGGEKFSMQSVYKLPIAMTALQHADSGKISMEQKVDITKADFVAKGQRSPIRDENPQGTSLRVVDLMEKAVSESDGTASDVLLRLVGGPSEVQRYLDSSKLPSIVVKNSEKEIAKSWQTQYENSATPDAIVDLLIELRDGKSVPAIKMNLIRDFMNESQTGPNRLRGLLPENTYVAHKTGTSGSRNGTTAATNDVGLIVLPNGKYLAIAVFVGDSTADEKTRESVIAKAAKAAWDKWGN